MQLYVVSWNEIVFHSVIGNDFEEYWLSEELRDGRALELLRLPHVKDVKFRTVSVMDAPSS